MGSIALTNVLNGNMTFSALAKELMKFEKETHEYEKKLKIAVIGTTSIQYFAKTLKYILGLQGVEAELYQSDYDGINMCLLGENPELREFSPDYIVILPHYTDIKSFPDIFAGKDEFLALLNQTVEKYNRIWKNISGLGNTHVFFCNFVIPYLEELGSAESNMQNSKTEFMRAVNREIMLSKPSYVTVVDLDSYASYVGKEKWFDMAAYFTTKTGFSHQFLLPVINKIVRLIQVTQGKMKKCLVLDLDNTLWGDVVGDVGPMGVILDPNDPEGEAYRYFQTYIKGLKERGVILAVCSKNDESLAKQVFAENPNMILKLDDIACFMANWEDKASNIANIASALNIGIDSIAFFDDNPAEREVVRRNLPQVSVIEVPDDPDRYAKALFDSGVFDLPCITKEDISRANTYVENTKREKLAESFVDYESYLRALEMEGRIERVSADNMERFVQLINKSNQFNLRTQRYKEKQIIQMLAEPAYHLFGVYLKDKFSYYGLIACVILKDESDNTLFVDTIVMSCRVLKRGVEDLIMDAIAGIAHEIGCKQIVGEYIRTERNSMVSDFYDSYGFEKTSDAGERKEYSIAVNEYKKHPTNNIRVIE